MHNRIDWCVRGYSHGFYNRGQDSAGLLMYEQSSRNTVAYNSITHGGDGLFLWAGQSTMDTGKGGSNDNRFFANDFSHAVTNGIEATFSRNAFTENRIEDCWHGVWGGYSFDSVWANNRFAQKHRRHCDRARPGQHGSKATRFDGDETAIRLWQNPTQDPNWGYPKLRDTRSRGYRCGGTRSWATTRRSTFARPPASMRALEHVREGRPARLAGDADVALDAPPKRPGGDGLAVDPEGCRAASTR